MTSNRPTRRACAWLLALAIVLFGCTTLSPGLLPLGTPIAQVRQGMLSPTAEFPLPGGGTRLEFAHGSFSGQTYMMDFNAAGTLVASQQVLTQANFADIVPGMTSDEVRFRLGRPANVINVGRQNLTVWNYRFVRGDCVWFQISIGDADQRVISANMGADPACDGPRGRVD